MNQKNLRTARALGAVQLVQIEGLWKSCSTQLPSGIVFSVGIVSLYESCSMDCSNLSVSLRDFFRIEGDAVMRTAPNWVRLGRLEAAWEPATPGSEWEAASVVCIKFQQGRIRELRGQEQASRVQVRKPEVGLKVRRLARPPRMRRVAPKGSR